MWTSAWSKTNTGAQVVVSDIVKATGVRAGGFDHQDPARDEFKIGAEVHAAFDRDDALLRRLNAYMPEDRLIQTLAPDRAKDNTYIGRRIQYPQYRHQTQVGGHAIIHNTCKRELTITERFYTESTHIRVLIILA